MAEKKFYINIRGKKGDEAVDVNRPDGNLDIQKIQQLARSSTPMVFDGKFAEVAMEILARYPIGNFPIVPKHGKESKFVRDGECDPNKVLLEDLLMEQREGPGGG